MPDAKAPSPLALLLAGAKPAVAIDGQPVAHEELPPELLPDGAVKTVVPAPGSKDVPEHRDAELAHKIEAANAINRAWADYYAQVNAEGTIEPGARRRRPLGLTRDPGNGRIQNTHGYLSGGKPIAGNNGDRRRHARGTKVRISARKGVA